MADKKVSVGVKEVQALNTRISKLNTQRTEVTTKINMYKSTLAEELKNYLDSFGVDLSGKTLGETKKLVMAEAEKVNATVQEEYDLKKKVVELIEMGDIDEANRLLGIVEEPEPEEEETEDFVEETEESEIEEDFSVDDMDLGEEEETDDFEDFGFSTEVESQEDDEVEEETKDSQVEDEEYVFEEEEDNFEDEDFGFGDLSVDDSDDGGTVEEEVDDDEEDSESPVTMGSDGFEDGDFSVDDLSVEDDLDEEDFGFGELLNGGNKF